MVYEIHSANGEVKCKADYLEYNGKWMGECSISVDVKSPTPFTFELGDYIDYRGVRYVLNNIPSVIKQSSPNKSGESFVYDKIKFNGPNDELMRLKFLDFVDGDGSVTSSNKTVYSQGPRFSFFCPTVETLIERIQVNLNREYDNWTIRLSDADFESAHNVNVDIDNISIWDACLLFNTSFKTSFIVNQYVEDGVRKNEIVVGEVLTVSPEVLSYGKGKGLTKVERSRDNDSDIINRLRAYGSQKNMPYRFYSDLYDPWYKLPLKNNASQNYTDPETGMPNLEFQPTIIPSNPDGWVAYPVNHKYEWNLIPREPELPIRIKVRFLNDDTNAEYNGYFTKYTGYDIVNGNSRTYYYRLPGTLEHPTGEKMNLYDTADIHNRYYVIVNIGGDYKRREAYFNRYDDVVITSGFTQTLMLYHKELRFSSVPLMPGAVNINNLMLPKFLDYIGVRNGKEYVLPKDKVVIKYDNVNYTRRNTVIEKFLYYTFNEESGRTEYVEYLPVYMYDEFGNPLLDDDGKWMVKLNTDPYIEDAESVAKYGVREGCVFFDVDNDSSETPEIYPTIENGDDEIVIGTDDPDYIIDDDGIPPIEGEGAPLKGDFKVVIPDIGFDIKDYLSDKKALMKMTTGACAGREFDFVQNNNNPIRTSKGYEVRLKRVFDETIGRYFPYEDAQIQEGDEFVLVNINLPRAFVDKASKLLEDAAIEYLHKYSQCTHIIIPTLDNIKLAKEYSQKGEESIYYKIREGCVLKFNDEDIDLNVDDKDKRMYVDTLTIRETPNELPKVEVKLAKEKTFSSIEKLRSDIKKLEKDISLTITKDDVKDVTEELIEEIGDKNYVNKNEDDVVQGKITFKSGFSTVDRGQSSSQRSKSRSQSWDQTYEENLEVGVDVEKDAVKSTDFESGFSGRGYALYRNLRGDSVFEVDNLSVRKKMSAREVEIQNVKHIGGAQIMSAAQCKAHHVEESADGAYYRVYYAKDDGEGNVSTNDWQVGDQAYMMTFDLAENSNGAIGNRFYWRVVVGAGDEGDYHYIDLSNEYELSSPAFDGIDDKLGYDLNSGMPCGGDNIVQLGNRLGTEGRTSAIELAGAGTDSPYIRQYEDITTFTLGDVDTQIKPGDNKFKGRLEVSEGSKGIGLFSDLPDEVNNAVKIGGENLLRNTGFDGDYASQKMEEFEVIGSEDKVYGQNLEFWTVSDKTKVESVESTRSVSGYECRFVSVGSWISQDITLIDDETYMLSFVCQGAVNVRGEVMGEALKTTRCKLKVKGTGDVQTIRFEAVSMGASIWDVKLERGTIQTDWCPAREDNDKMAGEFKDLWYLQHAFKGKTEILGGLILSSLIQLGLYRDGKMEGVTAGISGILEDENTDVAFWGGGNLEQANYAVSLFKDNPSHQPTEEQINKIAKAVITHAGRAILNDVVLRGYVYAKGGVFKGDVNAKRFIVDRTEAPLYENTGTVNQQGLVVNTAYITGRGVYILPELEEGQMVAVKWFNPAYVKYSGTTVTKFVGENNNVLITQKATNIVFHNSVSFGEVETLYEIIGDRRVGDNTKTYWSFVPIGGTIGNTGSGVDSWGPPIDLGGGGGLITPEYKDDTTILPPVGGGIIIQPLPDLSTPT